MLIIDKKANYKDIKQMNARIAAINGFSIFGKNHTYLLDENEEINFEEFENFVKKYSGEKFLIFGFTSLIFENLIQNIGKNKKKFDLSKGIILHGGGWKKLEKLKISNKKFKSILFKNFKIKQIINYYGLVEQTGSIYLECSDCSRFITSEFSNIIIRDDNLDPCKKNKTGMIQTMSLLPSSYPGHNILTEDIGEIKGEDDCYCGKKGKYFLVHGRIKKAEVGDVAMLHKKINYLIGKEISHTQNSIFNDHAINFFSDLSSELKKNRSVLKSPDLFFLMMWCTQKKI